jgi:hypothetical protein
MNPVKSPFAAFCKIRPTKSSVELEIGSPNQLTVATVEIEKPRSLSAKFWRSSAYALALVPGSLSIDAAAHAFERAGSTVMVTAPTYPTPSQPQMLAPKTSPAVETKPPQVASPVITFLRPIVTPLAVALATEAVKEAGKDLWKFVRDKLWPRSSSSEGEQELPSGRFTITVHVEELQASDALEGAPSETQLQQFVTEKPEELYRKIQARRLTAAELYVRPRTKHSPHVSFVYTPARKTNEPTNFTMDLRI